MARCSDRVPGSSRLRVAHAALGKALPDAKPTVGAGGLDELVLAVWAGHRRRRREAALTVLGGRYPGETGGRTASIAARPGRARVAGGHRAGTTRA